MVDITKRERRLFFTRSPLISVNTHGRRSQKKQHAPSLRLTFALIVAIMHANERAPKCNLMNERGYFLIASSAERVRNFRF